MNDQKCCHNIIVVAQFLLYISQCDLNCLEMLIHLHQKLTCSRWVLLRTTDPGCTVGSLLNPERPITPGKPGSRANGGPVWQTPLWNSAEPLRPLARWGKGSDQVRGRARGLEERGEIPERSSSSGLDPAKPLPPSSSTRTHSCESPSCGTGLRLTAT